MCKKVRRLPSLRTANCSLQTANFLRSGWCARKCAGCPLSELQTARCKLRTFLGAKPKDLFLCQPNWYLVGQSFMGQKVGDSVVAGA